MNIAYISEPHVAINGGFMFGEAYEGADGKEHKQLIYEGEFQRAGKANRNKRIYREHILKRENNKLIKVIESRGGIPMGLDHPVPKSNKDISSVQKLSLKNTCAMITELWEENGDVFYGKASILGSDSVNGGQLRSMIAAGKGRNWKPAVSSRGFGGNPVIEGQHWYVPEDYNMVTYDMVTDPSVETAILNMINEQNEWFEHQVTLEKSKKSNLYSVLIDLTEKTGVKL